MCGFTKGAPELLEVVTEYLQPKGYQGDTKDLVTHCLEDLCIDIPGVFCTIQEHNEFNRIGQEGTASAQISLMESRRKLQFKIDQLVRDERYP